MSLFLITDDRPAGQRLSIREYPHEAHDQAFAGLRTHASAKPNHDEVVLLHGRSLNDLVRTHSRYGKTAREIAQLEARPLPYPNTPGHTSRCTISNRRR